MDISRAKVVVTGGASGLGAATATYLREAGAAVCVFDRDAQGAAFAERIGAGFEPCDVTDDGSVQSCVARAADRMGGLTALVNCAGIAAGARVYGRDGAHDGDLFRRTIEVNLTGTFNMMRVAAGYMAAQDADGRGMRGVIVNTASVAAFEGQKGQAAYAASKAGIVGLGLPTARDLARQGIRVMAIAPGIFRTPMLEGLGQEIMDGLAQDVLCPPRLGEPHEFAHLVGTIIENDYLNATTIRLDGGLRMP